MSWRLLRVKEAFEESSAIHGSWVSTVDLTEVQPALDKHVEVSSGGVSGEVSRRRTLQVVRMKMKAQGAPEITEVGSRAREAGVRSSSLDVSRMGKTSKTTPNGHLVYSKTHKTMGSLTLLLYSGLVSHLKKKKDSQSGKRISNLEILNVWICLFILVSKKELGHFLLTGVWSLW